MKQYIVDAFTDRLFCGLTPLIDADGKPIVTKDGYQK